MRGVPRTRSTRSDCGARRLAAAAVAAAAALCASWSRIGQQGTRARRPCTFPAAPARSRRGHSRVGAHARARRAAGRAKRRRTSRRSPGDTRLLGVFAERDGRGYALFRLPSGPRLVAQGQEIAQGATLVAVSARRHHHPRCGRRAARRVARRAAAEARPRGHRHRRQVAAQSGVRAAAPDSRAPSCVSTPSCSRASSASPRAGRRSWFRIRARWRCATTAGSSRCSR